MALTLQKLGFVSLTAMILVLNSCKNKDPSVMKVFVRNESNELITNAKVIIIADVNSTPATPAYVDTVMTNSSGFAYFEMDEFFDGLDKDQTTGYFDVLGKKDTRQGSDYVKARAHITTVSTVYIQP